VEQGRHTVETMVIQSDSLFNDFYKCKKVLVTGHTGFKGSWLSIWLRKLGAEVVGYALDPYTDEDNFVLAGLNNKLVDVRGDIRDMDKLQEVFSKYKPEIVFHLAAQPLVRKSYEHPKDTYEINIMGTLNVLECIRCSNTVKVGVMVTSDKCYENREQIWGYRETDPMGGYDPYSSSKGCAELLIGSYRSSFMNPQDYKNHGKAIASVRAGNVIGGGDWCSDRLIPDCMRALINNKSIEIRNPGAVRPWQHVMEPLRGYLQLASEMWKDGAAFSSAWNFGPNHDGMIPVGDIVDKIIKEWSSGTWMASTNIGACHEANLLCLDCTKARNQLGWKPLLKPDQAVKYTVEWYQNYLKEDVYCLCKNQIKSYERVCQHLVR